MSSSGSRRRNLLLLGAAALLVIVGVLVGIRVAGVLLALVAPPGPPLPDSVTLISHEQNGHGSDEWVYSVAAPPCDVVAFLESEGGTCDVLSGWCIPDTNYGVGPGRVMATCEGLAYFSSFGLRWDAEIRSRTGDQNAAEMTISREILWSASPP